MIPRFGEQVVRQQRYARRPGAYAVLFRDNRVLLTHQIDPEPEFQLPGGGIDAGEQTIPALHREILEETGWKASSLTRIGAYRRFTFMPEYDIWAEKICHIYFGRPTMRIGPPTEEGHSAHWVSPELAIDIVASTGDKSVLKAILF